MDLIGRQRELHEVTELLEVAPAVVVTGAPGVGKSALARQLAPVVWVDAERAVDESTLLERLAAALDLPLARWGAVLDGLPGDGVVVVDGAEGARRAEVLLQVAMLGRVPLQAEDVPEIRRFLRTGDWEAWFGLIARVALAG